jgi:DNA-binding transcriptional LysR family regulator
VLNWDDLRLLLAVSRRGSFLKAGDMLGVAASTLSRRMTQLEEAVGEALVERGVDGVRLTLRGASLVEAAQGLEAELAHQTRLHHEGLSGTVSISAGDGFVGLVCEASRLFTARQPGCSVDFSVDHNMVKVSRGVADIAVRTVHLGEPSLIYRHLAAIHFGIYAEPAFAAALGTAPVPADAPMIDLLPPLDQLPHLRGARALGFSSARLRVSSFSAQLEGVRQGAGVAVLPTALGGDLCEPFGAIDLPPLDVFLVTRPQAVNQPHVRAFVEIMKEVFQARMPA